MDLTVKDTDNLSLDSTLLIVEGLHDRVEVNPYELYYNALENLPEEIAEWATAELEKLHKEVTRRINNAVE
jgi:hypothetical protein